MELMEKIERNRLNEQNASLRAERDALKAQHKDRTLRVAQRMYTLARALEMASEEVKQQGGAADALKAQVARMVEWARGHRYRCWMCRHGGFGTSFADGIPDPCRGCKNCQVVEPRGTSNNWTRPAAWEVQPSVVGLMAAEGGA